MENNVKEKLASIKSPFTLQPNLFSRWNKQWRGSEQPQLKPLPPFPPHADAIDDTEDEAHEEDEIVSSYRREGNYGGGAVYAAPAYAPPLPHLPYGYGNDYDYSYAHNKKYV